MATISSSRRISLFLVVVLVLVLAMAPCPSLGAPPTCRGNELQQVQSLCGPAILGGGRLNPQSQCCQTLRSMSFPCLCAQLNNSPYRSLAPSVASSVVSSCRLTVPKGFHC